MIDLLSAYKFLSDMMRQPRKGEIIEIHEDHLTDEVLDPLWRHLTEEQREDLQHYMTNRNRRE